ncbi:glycosyltransferase [Ideonella dechloratans]|uniref:glycosyltransferase n=1 Tax=Ideonella dechloratans TaxID=36863 RepID=UPI00147872F2|nr:glycosyltransferase [Ideonella dechloratans]UFU11102.1 glycosyltransferase [Ideonella dechloratans]
MTGTKKTSTGRDLKVLHINTTDLVGGAARAAFRLHEALLQCGVESRMLVLEKTSDDPAVLAPMSPWRRIWHQLKRGATARLMRRQHTPTNPGIHSLNLTGSGLVPWINAQNVDVVQLHWLGNEMLSVAEIARIRHPLVWTLHDMWPISGAEHYDDFLNPGRYREAYRPDNRPSQHEGPDLDAWTWQRKRKAWCRQQFHLVSPSQWLADCARQSALMSHQPCSVIPNCIDHRIYRPVNRQTACDALGLDPHRRYVLFGASSATGDPRKGYAELRTALGHMRSLADGQAGDIELLIFGATAPRIADTGLPFQPHYFGNLSDDLTLALLYSAADVFAAPSLQDNLPNTLVEAMACGLPCVAFRIGGMPDLIEHKATGWLAEPFEVAGFTEGLMHWLQRPRPEEACRRFSLCNHAYSSVAAQYQDLYNRVTRDRQDLAASPAD